MRPLLQVDPCLCQACAACQARQVCRTRAIVQFERGDLPVIEASRCHGCMVCIPECPFGAVRKAADVSHLFSKDGEGATSQR